MGISNVKKVVFYVPNYIYESFILELKQSAFVEVIPDSSNVESIKENFLGFDYSVIKDVKAKLEGVFNIFLKLDLKLAGIKSDLTFDENFKKEIGNLKNICDEVEKLDLEIKNLQIENQTLENKKNLLLPFIDVEINFKNLVELKYVKHFFLKVDKKKYKYFIYDFNKLNLTSILWKKETKQEVFLFFIYHSSKEKEILDFIKKYECQIYDMSSLVENSFKNEIYRLDQKINENNQKIFQLKNKIKEIYKKNFELLLSSYIKCLEIEEFINVQRRLMSTKYFKIVSCWVPQKFMKKLKSFTEKFSKDVSFLLLDPRPDEDIPVVFDNKRVFEPYEFVTKLYGYPKFGTIDPTSYLAPFFTIFFALCLSDIFYGVLLTFLWFLVRKKISKDSEYYGFVVLLKYLGIVSVIIGFTMDSFLGFSIFKNYSFPINPALFDPLNRPIDMLKFTFLLGYIQVIFGLFLATYKGIKDKDFLSAVDNFSWIIFITSFAPVVYQLFFPKDVNPSLVKIFSKISLFVFLFIVFFQSRDIKPFLLKPVNLFVKAYNTIGFYADMLSYSRILALALASSAIAQTVNMLVAKLLKAELLGIRFLEQAVAPILFLGGHLFNFAMGVLGGLVHSARLQYLEFFSKFFVAGGRPIKLFAPKKV